MLNSVFANASTTADRMRGDAPGIEVGTEVILFGRQNGDEIFVGKIACKAGTIAHEIFCGITNRVPKVYEENR